MDLTELLIPIFSLSIKCGFEVIIENKPKQNKAELDIPNKKIYINIFDIKDKKLMDDLNSCLEVLKSID